ncbi:MAG: branched-chain amino acid ABC transporter ATP-binding protein [Deltaproteobacteria bacterium RBG_16_48_10]|nr:MAG: branched-chain amino acid ABC transporter ATP-binding protein [Deltaproteobacteria bacterium RBG_16_48_10]
MLRIDRINVFYGDVQVLWDVSLKVNEEEIVTVVGPNGAGKSTLLMAVINLIHPKREDHSERGIFLNEARIDHLSPEETVRMGITIVPEGARVFPEMSVLDNLKMGSYIKEARELREQTFEEVYNLFPRLKERQSQKAKTLSGGERQMLALGRALMSKPALLLLDEPSLGLQPILVTRTFEAIREINKKGVTILLVEQNVNYSLEISHRAYVLENGRVVLEGGGKELLNNPHVKKAYLAM